jgi:hypothetical protein
MFILKIVAKMAAISTHLEPLTKPCGDGRFLLLKTGFLTVLIEILK